MESSKWKPSEEEKEVMESVWIQVKVHDSDPAFMLKQRDLQLLRNSLQPFGDNQT